MLLCLACRQTIGSDGVYRVDTEMPGKETIVGWGDDPEPHIHVHIKCAECAGGATFEWYNKWYLTTLCTVNKCGSPDASNLGTNTCGNNYVYHIVMDTPRMKAL
jgi:hypothetical protein